MILFRQSNERADLCSATLEYLSISIFRSKEMQKCFCDYYVCGIVWGPWNFVVNKIVMLPAMK